MKNVVITILAMLVLGLGGFLVYDKLLSNEKTQNNNEPSEEYTLMDKNNANVQYLYKGVRIRPFDKAYTTSNLKVSDRSQTDKLCSALEVTKSFISYEYTLNGVSEAIYTVNEDDLRMSYEKIFGSKTYSRVNEFNCACARYVYSDTKYKLVENGCGFTSHYDEEIEEVRKYNDRIEITTLYYYSECHPEVYDKWCTDETCNNILIEKQNGETIDASINAFETYKDKLNRLIYTYELSDDGFYYFSGTEIKTSGN